MSRYAFPFPTRPNRHGSLGSLATVLTSLWCASAAAATYHVAGGSGADTNDGSPGAPFATISACANVVAAGDTCLVHAGIYRETVSPARSGTGSQPIVFRAADGECVTVSGADPVSTVFTNTQPNLWVAPMADEVVQMFSNGTMIWEAQWPNRTPGALIETPKGMAGQGTGQGTSGGSDWYLVDPTIPVGDWTGATVFMLPGERWASASRSVKAYDPTTHTLMLDMTTPWASAALQMTLSNPYYLYDSLLALDVQDEWLHKNGSLYYFSTDDPRNHGLEYKRRSYAFFVQQSSIALVGFRVFGAAIRIEGNRNTVDSLAIEYPTHLRAFDAWNTRGDINLISGDDNVWKNSIIRKSGSSGLGIAGNRNLIENNVVEDVVYQATNQAGLDMWDWSAAFENNQFIRNTVNRSGRAGIFLQGTKGSRALYNRITKWALLTYDMGGIYAWGTDGEGTEIAYNDLGGSDAFLSNGIYLDDKTNHFAVHHNYVHDSVYNGSCIKEENDFFNNTFANVGAPFILNTDAQTGQWTNTNLAQVKNNLADGTLQLIVGVLPSAVNDWGYFQVPLLVTDAWKHVEIPFSDMRQRTGAIQVPFTLTSVNSLNFSPMTNGDFELDLDNLQLLGPTPMTIDSFESSGGQNAFGGWASASGSGDGSTSTGMTLTYASGGTAGSGLHAHVAGTIVAGNNSWGSMNESLPNVDLSQYTGLAFEVRGRMKSFRVLATGGYSPVQDHNAVCALSGTTVPSCAVDQGTALAGITDNSSGLAPDIGAFESGVAPWVAGAARTNDATICGKIADMSITLPPQYVSPWLKIPDAGVPDAGVPDVGIPDAGVPDVGVPDVGVPAADVPDAAVLDAAPPDAVVPIGGMNADGKTVDSAGPTDVAPLGDAKTGLAPEVEGGIADAVFPIDATGLADTQANASASGDIAPGQKNEDAGTSWSADATSAIPDRPDANSYSTVSSDASTSVSSDQVDATAGRSPGDSGADAGPAGSGSGCSCQVGDGSASTNAWPAVILLGGLVITMARRRRDDCRKEKTPEVGIVGHANDRIQE